MGESIFRARDAARIWGIYNPNTLNITLSRYVAKGLIFRIFKGLYSLKSIKDLDPRAIGLKVIGISYVSCESVLFDAGIINQPPQNITLVGRHSKHFSVAQNKYRSRQLKDLFLFNQTGINNMNGLSIATPERAVADMLYFNHKKHFDNDNIDWKTVRDIATKVGYNIPIPEFTKLRKVLKRETLTVLNDEINRLGGIL